MVQSLRHRGPDAEGAYADPRGGAALAHTRLAIVDLSPAGRQPMASADGRYWLSFNGEIYNYRELRSELSTYPFRTQTDTEVLLAAYERWGTDCLDRLIGMFAFLLWDSQARVLVAARDRFGVKPLYYVHDAPRKTLLLASEIKALHAAGVPAEPDTIAWATYLASGLHEHSERTFSRGVRSVPAGHVLTWQDDGIRLRRWYDLAARSGMAWDERPETEVEEEYLALLDESVRLRFRADVPVGVCLSGGVDSSTLLATIRHVQGRDSEVAAFTFTTGDDRYDELPWVRRMLAHTRHPLVECRLEVGDVPALAQSVQLAQDEPFGGLPTIAYAHLFAQARAHGVVVLLDGQGLDEQWAGYDYYRDGAAGRTAPVQGTTGTPFRPDCLDPEFRARAEPVEPPAPFPDRLRNLQYRDALVTKLPRALRFADRVSMRSSTELREPFLDHRLFELALRQPPSRKIRDGVGKWMLRAMVSRRLPGDVVEAPKRPLQTPQREWLRGPLHQWATDAAEDALQAQPGWFDAAAVRRAMREYRESGGESSVHIWQWINLALATRARAVTT